MSEKDIRTKAEIKSEIDKNNAETEKLAAETRKEIAEAMKAELEAEFATIELEKRKHDIARQEAADEENHVYRFSGEVSRSTCFSA